MTETATATTAMQSAIPSAGLLISIAGPSCSGKTTASEVVARRLDASLLHLDRYWVHGAPQPLVNGYPSREQPHQYDGADLVRDAKELLQQGRTVVAEGFLVLTYPEVVAMSRLLFFITVPHNILVHRRDARSRAGGNAIWTNQDGTTESRVDTGWQVHGEQEWARWGAPQARLPNVIVLDGTRPSGDLVDTIMEQVRTETRT